MSEPEEITTMSGQKLPLKMSVDYISFSAHTDYQQTSEFIRALKPPHVVSLWLWLITLKRKKTYPRNHSWFSNQTLPIIKVALFTECFWEHLDLAFAAPFWVRQAVHSVSIYPKSLIRSPNPNSSALSVIFCSLSHNLRAQALLVTACFESQLHLLPAG